MSTTPTPQCNALQARFSQFREGDLALLWDLARSLECQATAWAKSANEADDRLKVALEGNAHVTALYQSAEKECAWLRDEVHWQNEKEITRLRAALQEVGDNDPSWRGHVDAILHPLRPRP